MDREAIKTRKWPHYAWFVCAGCALLLFCTSGLCINAFTIYQPYILSLNGFTNAQSSLIVTVRSLFGFVSMLLTGVYYKKLSLRVGMAAAGMMTAAGFFIFGAAKSLLVYELAAAVAGLGYGFGTMIPIAVVLERWFIQKRTLAVGICSAVTGVSTLGIPSLLTGMIESLGLSAAFYIEGAVITGLVIVSFLLIRSRPADLGMKPYGDWEELGDVVHTPRTGRLTRKSWLLLVPMLLCVGAVTSVGYSHLTVLVTGEGFSAQTTALAITVSGITLTVSKFGYGWLSDKMPTRKSNWIFGAILTAGLLMCCFIRGHAALLFAAMIAYGVGLALTTVGLTAWAGDLSSAEQYDGTIRRFQTLYAAGGLLFSSLPGILADRFGGSYVPAFLFFAVCAAFVVLSVQWTYAHADRS